MSSFVMLHGFTGAPESFDSLRALLPSDSYVIHPTLSGHGAAPAFAQSWDEELDRLVGLLRAEQVRNAHLVGYSLGGRVGYGLLARAPELFSRATLIGAHPGLRSPVERAQRRQADRESIALILRGGLDGFLAGWEALPMWASQRRLPSDTLERQRTIRRSHTAAGLAHALAVLGLGEMPPVDPSAHETPITLVAGALDEKHAGIAKTFAPQLPRGRARIVPGAGHNVVLEAPGPLASILMEQD